MSILFNTQSRSELEQRSRKKSSPRKRRNKKSHRREGDLRRRLQQPKKPLQENQKVQPKRLLQKRKKKLRGRVSQPTEKIKKWLLKLKIKWWNPQLQKNKKSPIRRKVVELHLKHLLKLHPLNQPNQKNQLTINQREAGRDVTKEIIVKNEIL